MKLTHVVFDLNGTLTDPGALGRPWQREDLGVRMIAAAVDSAMVDALTGRHRPFSEHVSAAVAAVAVREGLDAGRVEQAVQAASALPAWPDAAPALRRLREDGLHLSVLTNSGAEGGEATLRAAGLLDSFDAVLGADAVESVKPDPRVYAYALEALGCAAAETLLVAAHGWDVTGARRAGLRTCWVARGELALIATAEPPDLRAADLGEAANAILAARASG